MSADDDNVGDIDVSAGYEKKDANPLWIAVTAIATAVMMAFFILCLEVYFVAERERLFDADKAIEATELQELRAREAEALSSNEERIVEGKMIYRIPIDRAMALMVEEAGSE